jgi:hypothetical protein
MRPLIAEVVSATIAQLESVRATLPDNRLAYSEAEAADMLGLNPNQLRDERKRKRIKAATGPGRKVLYTRQQLLDYLASRPWRSEGNEAPEAARRRSLAGMGRNGDGPR